jgi:hypothetical protein
VTVASRRVVYPRQGSRPHGTRKQEGADEEAGDDTDRGRRSGEPRRWCHEERADGECDRCESDGDHGPVDRALGRGHRPSLGVSIAVGVRPDGMVFFGFAWCHRVRWCGWPFGCCTTVRVAEWSSPSWGFAVGAAMEGDEMGDPVVWMRGVGEVTGSLEDGDSCVGNESGEFANDPHPTRQPRRLELHRPRTRIRDLTRGGPSEGGRSIPPPTRAGKSLAGHGKSAIRPVGCRSHEREGRREHR